MIAFVDSPRFPDDVSEAATGGPSFNTSVFVSDGGLEQRSILWRRPRHKYTVDLGIRTDDDMTDVIDFFYLLRGKAVGFRFKDWNDYQLTNETIGTGDGVETEFEVTKTYTAGALSFVRRIYKVVDATYTVKVNGVTKTEDTDYTINIDTGVVSFLAAPTNGHAITITCEFDVPVRLDVDDMEASHVGYQAQEWGRISLVEVMHDATAFAISGNGLFFNQANNSQYVPVVL